MYRFQHIEYLWLLLLVPAATFVYIFYLRWRSARIARLGAYDLVKSQIAGRISGRLTTKFVLIMLALICAIFGLANLQKGAGMETAERKGIDVIFALDVSKSMLAKDIQPDRLTRSKQLIERMMDKMKNDRVGLVVFAGKAYLQTPLTVDYSAVKMLLASVGPDMVPTQGTVLAEAIGLADKSFSEKEKKYKALVLISDGEDHDEEAQSMAKQAAEQGVVIHTVGVGSPEGASIIDPATGKEKLDGEGKPVITKLNEAELQGIAQAGGGGYQHLDNANSVADNLSGAINNIEGRNMGAVIFTQYKSYFQYFIAGAILLLVIEWLIPSSRIVRKNRTTVVKAGTGALSTLLLLFFTAVSGFAQAKNDMKAAAAANDQVYKGNQLYRDKQYKEAIGAYEEALKHDPGSLKGKYNLGNALYDNGQYEQAGEQFASVAEASKDKAQKAGSYHNLGNSFMKQQKWQEAVDALKQSLKLNPADEDTRYNLAYAQEKLKQQNKDNKNKNKDNKDKKDNKDQKDKKDQPKDDKGNQPKDDKGDQDKKNDGGDKDKKDEKGDEPPQQQPQQMPSKLSEKQAENLLNALRQEEKKLQDKKNKERGVPVKLQKDW